MKHNYSIQFMRTLDNRLEPGFVPSLGKVLGQSLALGLCCLITAPSLARAQQVNGPVPGSTRLPQVSPSSGDPFRPVAAPFGFPAGGVRTVDPSVYADEDYLLGSGDVIQVQFFNVPELSGRFQILPNGTVNLPQLGAVPLRGRTITAAEQVITSKAASILRYPNATVSLDQARPITVAIAGEVTSPGTYTLRPGDGTTAGTIPSLTETLKLAQGVTQSADLSRVIVRRPNPLSRTSNEVVVNLWQLIDQGDINQDLRLRDGDSVLVPSTSEINLDLSWRMADIAFATPPDRPIKISIIGEVNRPGPYTLSGQTFRNPDGNTITLEVPTVTSAIQTAGGITQSADVRNIVLKRTTRTGPDQERRVDFWKLLKDGDFRQDLPLQDGDTIQLLAATEINDEEIAEVSSASFSPNEITVMVAGEVERPGPITLKPNDPMNKALLAAGGFNGRANRKEMTLLRLNPNGTVSQKEVRVDLAASVNSNDNNPPLRDGDTIVVARSNANTAGGVLNGITGPLNAVTTLLRLFTPFGFGGR